MRSARHIYCARSALCMKESTEFNLINLCISSSKHIQTAAAEVHATVYLYAARSHSSRLLACDIGHKHGPNGMCILYASFI